MRLRDGTPTQKVLLALVIGVQLVVMTAVLAGVRRALGQPHPGWYVDELGLVAPMRTSVASSGLRGGGRLIEINGLDVSRAPDPREAVAGAVRLEPGQSNALVIRHGQELRTLEIEVAPLGLADFLYGQSLTLTLGTLFFAVGLLSFLLRPWEIGSWALLAFCHFASLVLWVAFTDPFRPTPVGEAYLRALTPMLTAAALHLSLALPALHPLLLRSRSTPLALYAGGTAGAVLALHAWQSGSAGIWSYVEQIVRTAIPLAVALFFMGRCTVLAFRPSDRLVAQRARILLAGALVGGALPVAVRLVQLDIDPRYPNLTLIALLWALAYTTLRPELLHARVAVRRALTYGAVVLGLTAVAIALSSLSRFAVAGLLLPVLYLWPRFERQLDDRLYPKRARMVELAPALIEEIADTDSVGGALEVLARGAAHLFDARSAVAVLFSISGEPEQVGSFGTTPGSTSSPLEKEPLVQILAATRREVHRDQIPVEPQYARILEDSRACLDRLDAEVLIPIMSRERVVGVIAMGPRGGGERYRAFEVATIGGLIQSVIPNTVRRIRASERLRAREREFGDLRRFLPATIIEQVMARGGASELRSQRRQVSVLFADLRGFTAFSEQVEPEELMSTLADYHETMGRRISEFAGTLERFAGDGFMVFFNDPVEQPDHAARAARMALAMCGDVDHLREGWERRGWSIHIGIGIATGYATVGFIGYEGRRDYAVIGAVTNLAARLSDRAAPGEILISAATAAELPPGLEREPAGEFELAGFSRAQPAHRLLRG